MVAAIFATGRNVLTGETPVAFALAVALAAVGPVVAVGEIIYRLRHKKVQHQLDRYGASLSQDKQPP
jgi:hypothetical protein